MFRTFKNSKHSRNKRSKSETYHKLQKLQIYAKTNYLYIAEMTTKLYQLYHFGGIGVISVLSNIYPKETSKMVDDYLNGNIEEARKTQLKYIPLINALFSEVNPIPVKAALNIQGYNFRTPRLPLTPATEKTKKTLEQLIQTIQ